MGARFKELEVWHNAMEIVRKVYEITKGFPEQEKYGLCSQLQRASVSVPSNIAEGSGRGTRKEFVHFLNQARGSLYEIITQLEIAAALSFADKDSAKSIEAECEKLAQRLNALISSLKSAQNANGKQRAASREQKEMR